MCGYGNVEHRGNWCPCVVCYSHPSSVLQSIQNLRFGFSVECRDWGSVKYRRQGILNFGSRVCVSPESPCSLRQSIMNRAMDLVMRLALSEFGGSWATACSIVLWLASGIDFLPTLSGIQKCGFEDLLYYQSNNSTSTHQTDGVGLVHHPLYLIEPKRLPYGRF